MNLVSGAASLPEPFGLVGLAIVAFGVPALLFEFSLHRRHRQANRGLQLAAEAHAGFVRVRWHPIAVPVQDVLGFRVLRERAADSHRVTWTINAPDQAALDDWGIQAGEQYRFTVEMYLENARGEAGFVVGTVAIAIPKIKVPREV